MENLKYLLKMLDLVGSADDDNSTDVIIKPERRAALISELQQLFSRCIPPFENGENRYGVDISYFRKTINRELNHSLSDFKPDELARVLARLSVTADQSVIFEPEFEPDEHAIKQLPNFLHVAFSDLEDEGEQFRIFNRARNEFVGSPAATIKDLVAQTLLQINKSEIS